MNYLTKEELVAKIQDIEWDDFEVKAARTELPKNIWETVSAFSNTSGGWIVCGVAQHGKLFEIEGVDNPEKIESDFLTALRNKDKFNLILSCKADKIEVDGKTVLAFYVPSSKVKPIWFNNPKNTFIRSGSGDQRATDMEVMAMYHDQSFGTKSDETVKDTSLKDLNPSSLDTYRRCIRYDNPSFQAANVPDEDFCYQTGIASRKTGELTYAGLVMLGKRSSIMEALPAFWVDYIEIPGTSYDNASQPYTYRMQELDNIWEYYNAIFQRLKLYCDNPMYFTPSGATPEDESQLYALREGLVNFLAHSDLFSPMHPTIRVYFDRIEFQNPGGFHLPLEKALTEIVSQPRNPILIRLFRFAKLGENAGYGIQRMKKWTELTGGAVDFKSDITHSTVTYWRTEKSGFEHNSAKSSTQDSTQSSTTQSQEENRKKTGRKQEGKQEETRKKTGAEIKSAIKDAIREDPEISISELAEKIRVSSKSIEWNLNKMRGTEIRREGPDKGGHWVILK